MTSSTPIRSEPADAAVPGAIQGALNGALAPPHPLAEFWWYFSANRGALVGFIFTCVLVLTALSATWISPHPPNEQYRDFLLAPPAWSGGTWNFVLGTDDIGRDILSRIIHGTQVSISIGVLVVVLSVFFGVMMGLAAGFARGRSGLLGVLDTAVMRAMDVMLALPSLLMAIVVVAVLGPSLVNAALAVVVVQLPHYVRITRASVLSEMSRDYVTATRLLGASPLRLMVLTVLPNCLAPLIVQSTWGLSTAILDLAALGFLGLGAQPPTPEWGTMLANAMQFIQSAWWVVTFPGLAILITVLAFNLMGDGLRDALDPKLKQ
ncbi:MAG: ABC transporter permease subunit [Deltaproteobacteria bacterium]|nr:ABC transporter permease subunit [Deltaproteobacteria bacterium]